jgi:WD40 repeat protein
MMGRCVYGTRAILHWCTASQDIADQCLQQLTRPLENILLLRLLMVKEALVRFSNKKINFFALGTVKIFDVASRQCIYTFSEHKAPVWALAFDDTGKRLVSGGEDALLIQYTVL